MIRKLLLPLLLLGLLLPLTISPVYGDGENWLSGYIYRISHTIDQLSGADTNYCVGIKVYNNSGVNDAEIINGIEYGKVYIDNKTQSDFDDIRFTDNDGITTLDYWIENKSDQDYAQFWVEIADNLTISDVNIYMYYGNNSVSTASNCTETFPASDDGNDYDLTYNVAGSQSINHNADYINVTGGDSSDDGYVFGYQLGASNSFMSSTIDNSTDSSGSDERVSLSLYNSASVPSPMINTAWNPNWRFQIGRKGASHGTNPYKMFIRYMHTSSAVLYWDGDSWESGWHYVTDGTNRPYSIYLYDDGTNYKADIYFLNNTKVMAQTASIAKASVKSFSSGRSLVSAEPYTSHYWDNSIYDSWWCSPYISGLNQDSWGSEESNIHLTCYFNNGGEFRVNNFTMTNGSTQGYRPDYELASLPMNRSYVFESFNWTGGTNITNPYDLILLANNTVWCYFGLSGNGTGNGSIIEVANYVYGWYLAIFICIIGFPLIGVMVWSIKR
jgi:hypothetical protein